MKKSNVQEFVTVRLRKETHDKVKAISKSKKWSIVTTIEVAIDHFFENNEGK